MKIFEYSQLTLKQKTSVLNLWNEEYPVQMQYNSVSELDSYLSTLFNSRHFFLENNDDILGWAVKFNRDSEKWFVIILSSRIHFKGFGRKLLNKIQQNESKLNGWVVDNESYIKSDSSIYKSPIIFYYKNGFKIDKNIRLELPNLSAVKISWKKD